MAGKISILRLVPTVTTWSPSPRRDHQELGERIEIEHLLARLGLGGDRLLLGKEPTPIAARKQSFPSARCTAR